jgi:hypothetical protein
MLNIMRITMALTVVVAVTIAGFAIAEPTLGLLGLGAAILFLKADWSKS